MLSYQRLYFRNVLHPLVRPSIVGRSTQQRNSEQVVSPAPDPQSSNEQSDEAPPSHIFDGKHQTKDTAAYQLCDIVDPMLKAMIEDESSVRDECNVCIYYSSRLLPSFTNNIKRNAMGGTRRTQLSILRLFFDISFSRFSKDIFPAMKNVRFCWMLVIPLPNIETPDE